jgi:hypothetical protein
MINFSNLPWNNDYNIIHYIIDDSKHFEIKNQLENDDYFFKYNLTVEQSSVHFIRLTNSSIIPKEGPEVSDIPFLLRLRILDPFTRILGIILMIIIFG